MPDSQQTQAADLSFRLKSDGATVDPETLALILAGDPDRTTIEAILSVPSQGRPPREYLVAITDLAASRRVATDFATPGSILEMSFVAWLAPEWSLHPDGFARLTPATGSRAHGAWAKAQGDGLYRSLLRWSGADFEFSIDRRFSFGARVARAGSDWSGVRVDAYVTSTGASRLQLRDYTGAKGATRTLATTDAPWEFDAWHWLDVEVAGGAIKARIYPEAAQAPDWQVSATTDQIAPGAFGPGGFPALDESPAIDIRRMEYHPLGG